MSNSIGLQSVGQLFPKRLTFGRNDRFDVLFIILGALPFYLPIALYLGESGLSQTVPFDWLFYANQLISMPHVWATYARLNRKISEKKVGAIFGWPAYVAILTLLIVATCKGFVLQALTAINVWQSYHYLRQTYGVSRFFARPDGETDLERKLSFWSYHGAMPLLVLGRWNMLFVFWHGKPSDAIIPVSFPTPLMNLLWIVAGASLLVGLYAELLKYRRSTATYDCSALLTLTVYYAIHWYGFLSIECYFAGFFCVTVFHALQYLGIAWKLEDRQRLSNTLQTKILKMVPASLSFVAFLAGLYFLGDFIQTHVFGLGDRFWPQFTATCLSTISAHHYLVDTVLWNRKAGV